MKALVAGAVLTGLIGCSAAEAPCLIQRPPTGGYSILFKRQGAVPSGCTDVTLADFENRNIPDDGTASPDQWWDNWRFDVYTENQLVFRSDLQPTPDPGQPDDLYISKGKLTTSPTTEGGQPICTATDMSQVTSADNLFGIPGPYNIHATEVKFLDGARYQGSQAQITADLTFGTCTATYVGIGATPSAFLEVVPPCREGPEQDKECGPSADLTLTPPRSVGSGYNLDYPMGCRLDIGLAYEYGPPPYCLEFNDDGTCATPDPDTRQKGVCFFPADSTFPKLK